MRLIVLTGASGSGKTTIAKAFQARLADRADVLFFDSIGIPSTDRMIAEFGSTEEWQRVKTIEWMAKIAARSTSERSILFEGQVRLAFLTEAISAAGLSDHRIILLDCNDATRRRRLGVDRVQPHLANARMLNWAKFLRNEATRSGCEILDTSSVAIDTCVDQVARHLP
jgi:shikimate kinase